MPLRKLEGVFERRKPPGFGPRTFRDPQAHGAKLNDDVAAALDANSVIPSIEGVDPALILRVTLAGAVSEDEWTRLGLTVLSEEPDKTLLLFANDKELHAFREKIAAYQGELPLGQANPPYAALISSIEGVGLATPTDRIGIGLKSLGFFEPANFGPTDDFILDVELHHPNDKNQADLFVFRLEKALAALGGKILNTYSGTSLLLCRIEAKGAAIQAALLLPEVARIETLPEPDLQSADLGGIEITDLTPGNPPKANAVRIAVLDSGVNSGHPLLGYVVEASFAAQPQWPDADEHGHGTSVASVAAYGDVESRSSNDDFAAECWILSARVVDQTGKFPKDISVPQVMTDCIRKLNAEHGCRIFNISLGHPDLVFSGGRPDPWASALDDLARELDVLIVVSAGNRTNLTAEYGDAVIAAYPGFLEQPASRIIEPATAAIALTVGAVAHANGLDKDDVELVGVQPICSALQPSPFTRTGPGVRGMIKPDLVDLGGNSVWDGPTQSLVGGGQKPSAGIWTFHNEPLTRLFRSRSGTSFAAPIVAHKAALLLERFPNCTANFLRSMLALSASVPATAKAVLAPLSNVAVPMTCGHGIAEVDHAIGSDDSRVVFFAEDEIEIDRFVVYEVPIPEAFQQTPGDREIKVSLAFDPPVRRTRADYLGVTMGWRLLRGVSSQDVFDKFRKWEKAEGEPPEFPPKYDCATEPKSTLREKGTLQCATYIGKRNISTYGNKYFLAVWCRRRWAPANIRVQKFSVAVQLRHAAVETLYQEVTQPVKIKV